MVGYEILKFVRDMNEEVVEDAVKERIEVCSGRTVVGDTGRGLVACGRKTDIEADAKEDAESGAFLAAVGQGAGGLFSIDHDVVDGFDGTGGMDAGSDGAQDGARSDIEEIGPGLRGNGLGSFEFGTKIDVTLSALPGALILAVKAESVEGEENDAMGRKGGHFEEFVVLRAGREGFDDDGVGGILVERGFKGEALIL